MTYIKQRILAFIVLLLGFLAVSISKAQNVVQNGNTFIEQRSDSSRGVYAKTDYIYIDSKGQKDTICLSKSGKAFIWKTSKKTGNRYRKYLPEITKKFEEHASNKNRDEGKENPRK